MKHIRLFESFKELSSEIYLILADFIEEEGCYITIKSAPFGHLGSALQDVVHVSYVPGTNYDDGKGGIYKRKPDNAEEMYDDMIHKLIDNGFYVFGKRFVKNYGFHKFWILNFYITRDKSIISPFQTGDLIRPWDSLADCCLNDLEKYKSR